MVIYLVIDSLIQSIFIEHLLYTKSCARYQECKKRQVSPHGVDMVGCIGGHSDDVSRILSYRVVHKGSTPESSQERAVGSRADFIFL